MECVACHSEQVISGLLYMVALDAALDTAPSLAICIIRLLSRQILLIQGAKTPQARRVRKPRIQAASGILVLNG
jgi:hypothetical protein